MAAAIGNNLPFGNFPSLLATDQKKDINTVVPFPGIRAKFELTEGDWKIHDWAGLDVVRELRFENRKIGALFQEMAILGLTDGSVCLFIKINHNHIETGCNYLFDCGIDVNCTARETGSYVSNKQNTELLFKILAKQNKFPEGKFPLLYNLVTHSDWRDVTPLLSGEMLPEPWPLDLYNRDYYRFKV